MEAVDGVDAVDGVMVSVMTPPCAGAATADSTPRGIVGVLATVYTWGREHHDGPP